jgi:hypothetical protein
MHWPGIERIATLSQLPDGYRFEQLKRSQIPALIEAFGSDFSKLPAMQPSPTFNSMPRQRYSVSAVGSLVGLLR